MQKTLHPITRTILEYLAYLAGEGLVWILLLAAISVGMLDVVGFIICALLILFAVVCVAYNLFAHYREAKKKHTTPPP
jgi:hypothetical protein